MATPGRPCQTAGVEGPQSFLFFVVAKVGPGESHRPVSVTLWQGGLSPNEAVQGLPVARACLQAIDVFSDPGNRTAIQGELNLATGFYKNDHDGLLVPRTELPELNRWQNSPSLDAKRQRVWNHHLAEFPFISTSLLLGVGYDQSNGSKNNARNELLGTVYRDSSIEYGMVVIDVSDLDDIRYGIVGFAIEIQGEDLDSGDDDISEMGVPTVEEHRPRKPLSVNEYMTRFHPSRSGDPYAFGDIVKRLEEKPLIAISAMDFIWPSNTDGERVISSESHQETPNERSLGEQATKSQIDSLLNTDSSDISLFDKLRTAPNIQDILLRHLHERSEQLNISTWAVSFGQLLGIAFAKQLHLDWVLLKGLTTDAIGAALETQELKDARSISVCIDNVRGTPAQLLEALSRSKNLRELYFFQQPVRETDKRSTELFLELSSTAYASLLKCKLFLTGSYSAGLRKTFWLPTTTYNPNIEVFPTQHMFVRHQIGTSPQFWPNHFYLGDALLNPERFAAGFLQYLRSLITGDSMVDETLYSFSCAPSTLTETSHTEVSPIPAESFSIPVRPLAQDNKLRLLAECWPKVRDLAAGSWVVLVSKEKYVSREAARTRTWPPKPTRATFLKYALVRLKMQVLLGGVTAILEPEMVEVGGLKEFLREMAPETDPKLVDQRVKELRDYVSNAPQQVALGPGLDWVSVFEPHEACSMLKDFLEDAAFVNGTVKLAMKENPKERDWYPELLDEQAGSGVEEKHSRNTGVFKALYADQVRH